MRNLAITTYFKDLAIENKTIDKNEQYKVVTRLLDNPQTYVQLQFVADVAPMFTKFLQDFLHEGSMIHVLYPAVRELMATIVLRYLETKVVWDKTGIELRKINVRDVKNMRTLQKFEIGEAMQQALTKMFKVEQNNGILLEMRNFFICCAECLQKNLPLDNDLLGAVQCLSPSEKTKTGSEVRIKRLAKKMPQIIADGELSSLTDEWKLYALDCTPPIQVKNHEVTGQIYLTERTHSAT